MLILRRQNQRIWNADSKRRSKTPLIQAIVRAQVNRKGVYMTSYLNVRYMWFCVHASTRISRFALITIVNAHFWPAFMLILRRRFETLIQNADPKRRSRKYCSCFPREDRSTTFTEEGMSRNSTECLIQAIVRAQVNRKGVYMTSFKRGYNVILRVMLPPESAFCSNHDRKRIIFGRFESAFWNAFIRK